MRRYRSFDGLRGLAILMVFCNHYGPLFLPRVWAMSLWPGVDLFFVLSGFLITGILYDSKDQQHYFRDFYIRRTLRIFPLYYGFFLAIFLLTPVLHLHYQPVLWSHLLYLANLTRTHPNISNPTVIQVGSHRNAFIGLGALWSLCVEEQFYVIWPFLLRWLKTRQAMMRFCFTAVIFVPVLRTALYFHNPAAVADSHYLYFVTYARCDGLFIGSWLALWLRENRLTQRRLHRIAYALIALPSGVLVIGAATVGRHWPFNEVNPLLCTYGYSFIALVSAGVLLLALDDTSFFSKVLQNKRLAALGLISYGFYLFHGLVVPEFELLQQRFFHSRLQGACLTIVAFFLVYGISWASFRFYESPFLRLKDRLAPGHRSVPSGREVARLVG